MVKSMVFLVGGIFIGAVSAEIIHKKCPNVMNDVYTKTCEITSGIKDAFKKGYSNAMQSQPDAEPSV